MLRRRAAAVAALATAGAVRLDDDDDVLEVQGDSEEWLAAINMYRCMHGSPPVAWNEAIAQGAEEWAKEMPPMRHSHSYELSPPQGENLAANTGVKDIDMRVASWYNEVNDCLAFPGCEKSKTAGKAVGHFTALVWKGVKEVGCGSTKGSDGWWYYVCRFSSGEKLSFDTPNMHGGYTKNVFKQAKSEKECKSKQANGLPAADSQKAEADEKPAAEKGEANDTATEVPADEKPSVAKKEEAKGTAKAAGKAGGAEKPAAPKKDASEDAATAEKDKAKEPTSKPKEEPPSKLKEKEEETVVVEAAPRDEPEFVYYDYYEVDEAAANAPAPAAEADKPVANSTAPPCDADDKEQKQAPAQAEPQEEDGSKITPAEAATAEKDSDQWLQATNKYRCMHGSPPVTWSEDLAKQAKEWVDKMPPMKHSSSYYMTPPQGENLAMNMPHKDIVGSVRTWYSEVEYCDKLPGCEKSKVTNKHTGHFTALVWNGVKEIGCASQKGSNGAWYYVCRYTSGPKLSYDTPNMGGGYQTNVHAKVKNESECATAAASKAAPASETAGGEKPADAKVPEKAGDSKNSTEAAPPAAGSELPAGDATLWLNATNRYRCMHGSPPVTWNAEVAKGAQEWAEKMPPMQHSNSYELNPPCGENLAMNMPTKDIPGRVTAWYQEVEDCISFPGCEKSKTKGKHVGHFTALIWKGVKQIGCGSSRGQDGAWYYVCRYTSGRTLSFDTPNMGGGYTKNVFARSDDHPDAEQCKSQFPLPPQ
eukprot:TRINITY_DN4929_c0_g1_i1.p1 TRINITY_DN4929_c0_g1~~TRINITY_DN4929_c0_g1_i1.p1  ORF type:complete len:759 (-),score=224.82 TRINITY_DN4929_c0_g1_i1:58-2334(-)